MKVLILTNVPSPYRVWFFSELGLLCDLTVLYESAVAGPGRNRLWRGESNHSYREIVLEGRRDVLQHLSREYDCIIIGQYSTPTARLAISYMRRRKIPFGISTDGGFISKEPKWKRWVKRHYMKAASWWLSTGKQVDEYLIYYGAKPDRIFHYPFTSLLRADLLRADELRRQKEALREKLGMKERKILLSVGRFSFAAGYGKGYDTLMRVAEQLGDDVGVYIVGDEPTDEFMRWKEEKHLDHVHFIGFQVKEDLAEYYAAADIFILLTRMDIWGLVVNEAMSFSLPVITTLQCMAGRELIGKEGGFLVEAGDSSAAFAAVQKLLESDELIARMGERNRSIIEEYTIENMAAVHKDILDQISKLTNSGMHTGRETV